MKSSNPVSGMLFITTVYMTLGCLLIQVDTSAQEVSRLDLESAQQNAVRASMEANSHANDDVLIIDASEAKMGSGTYKIILSKLAPSVRAELFVFPSAENRLRYLKAAYVHNGESQQQYRDRLSMVSSTSNQSQAADADAEAIKNIAPNVKIPNLDRASVADRKKAYYDAYRAAGMSMSDARAAVEKLDLH
jgi:hypothetical protein